MTFLPIDPSRRARFPNDFSGLMGPWGIPSQQAPSAEEDPEPSPTAPANPQQQLPTPPPSVKKATIWDKDHVAETLAGISQAFLSNQNFGEGLGAAAGVMGSRMSGLREEQKKSVSLGGPDSAFEVITDPRTGERTYRPVKAFQEYGAEKYRREHGPTTADSLKAGASTMQSVLNLPPARRPQAAAAAKAYLKDRGYDVGNLPDAENYSDAAASMARDMGIDAPRLMQDDAAAKKEAELAAYRAALLALRRQGLGISQQRETREAKKSNLPKPPPNSARAKLPAGFILD